jgi:hypothetical protein
MLRALVQHNYPPSCFSADELDSVASIVSDSDLLTPKFSSMSSMQEYLAAYCTVSGVLMGLPSPVAKRPHPAIRFPESARLSKKIRDSQTKFSRFMGLAHGSSSREAMLLDVLPMWRVIGGDLDSNDKRELRELCEFPLRGRRVVEDMDVEITKHDMHSKSHHGGWLEEDDIED